MQIIPDHLYDDLKRTVNDLDTGAMPKRAWLKQFNREIAMMARQGYEVSVDGKRIPGVYKAQDGDEDDTVALVAAAEGFLKGRSFEVPIGKIKWVEKI